MKSRLTSSLALALMCFPLAAWAPADSSPASAAPQATLAPAAADSAISGAGAAARLEVQARVRKLEEDMRRDSLSVDKRFALGNAYYDEGRLNEALIQFNRIVEMDSTFWKAWVNIGTVNDELSKTSLATVAFQKAIELHPGDTFAYVKLANSAYAHGDVATGIENYRKALAIDRKCLEAHFMLGNAFAEQEMYRQAVREWKRVQFFGGAAAPESKLAQDNLQTVYAFFAEEPEFLKKIQAITAQDTPGSSRKATGVAAKAGGLGAKSSAIAPRTKSGKKSVKK